jgi:para-nitrobenzyl esterase
MTTIHATPDRGTVAPSRVHTNSGAVRGLWENEIAVFRGIPYAEPPVGTLRFRPPVRRRRWDTVLDATRFGQIVPQTDESPIDAASLPKGVPQGDDCLNLNVWTPTLENASLPVLFWIHGGSFMWGSGSVPAYDGSAFARNGVVVVTCNYRLNAAGFLYVDGRPGAGCFGLLDQILALEWVHENIRRFGGDPSHVTIAGESAGGFSVGHLCAAPKARGLFRRGIAQSGGAQLHLDVESARVAGEATLRLLGVRPHDNDAIAEIPTHQLLAAHRAVKANGFELLLKAGCPNAAAIAFGLVPLPTYGTDVLPQPSLRAIESGSAADVDLLVGHTAEETNVFWPHGMTEPALPLLERAGDVAFARAGVAGAQVLQQYRELLSANSLADVVVPFTTDLMFCLPSIRLAEAALTHNPRTYMFCFGWKGRIGAVHGLDVPFMFDTLDRDPEVLRLLGGEDAPQSLATLMHGAWVNFVKDGTPRNTGLPEWPPYDLARRATMHLNVKSRIVEDPNGETRHLWSGTDY